MKYVVFVWIPILLFALFQAVPVFTEFPVPFDGAIALLGASIAGYVGAKSAGIFMTARELPAGEGVDEATKKKYRHILIALYIIIGEGIIVTYMNPDAGIPLDTLFQMAGACAFVVLAGNQAVKSAEKIDGGPV